LITIIFGRGPTFDKAGADTGGVEEDDVWVVSEGEGEVVLPMINIATAPNTNAITTIRIIVGIELPADEGTVKTLRIAI
jgi:hypothetical protein